MLGAFLYLVEHLFPCDLVQKFYIWKELPIGKKYLTDVAKQQNPSVLILKHPEDKFCLRLWLGSYHDTSCLESLYLWSLYGELSAVVWRGVGELGHCLPPPPLLHIDSSPSI